MENEYNTTNKKTYRAEFKRLTKTEHMTPQEACQWISSNHDLPLEDIQEICLPKNSR